MHEVTARVADDSPYALATAGTDATVELWCNDHRDLLHVRGPAAGVREHVEAAVGVSDAVAHDDELLLVTADCLREHEDTIEPYVAANDCLLVPPIRYERGAKVVRVLALDPANLTGFYRDLTADHDVTVEAKHDRARPSRSSPLVDLDAVLPDLSPRQREALVTAFEAGYYEIPREATTEDLGEALGVDRRTAEEHLRRAENKLLGALAPKLR
jgi:predicted DNA binding protein